MIIQIATDKRFLYALTDEGQICRMESVSNPKWELLEVPEMPDNMVEKVKVKQPKI